MLYVNPKLIALFNSSPINFLIHSWFDPRIFLLWKWIVSLRNHKCHNSPMCSCRRNISSGKGGGRRNSDSSPWALEDVPWGITHLLWSHLELPYPTFLWVPAVAEKVRISPKASVFLWGSASEAVTARQLCFQVWTTSAFRLFCLSRPRKKKKKHRNEESSSGLKQRRRKQSVLSFWWIFPCREHWISLFSRYHFGFRLVILDTGIFQLTD